MGLPRDLIIRVVHTVIARHCLKCLLRFGLLWSLLTPVAVAAQQSSSSNPVIPNPDWSAINLQAELQQDGSVRLKAPERYVEWTSSRASQIIWGQLGISPGGPGIGPGQGRTFPVLPPAPTVTLGDLGYSAVGPTGLGTLFESTRDPNCADCPGGSILFIPPTRGEGPTPPVRSNTYNVRSTRQDTRSLLHTLGEGVFRNAALPDIAIRTSPTTGVVNIPTRYWVDRATYGGQPLVVTTHFDVPWTLDYDVDFSDEHQGPCPDNPDETCVTHTTHTEHFTEHHVDHLDTAIVFTPTSYVWDFGDGRRGSRQVYDPSAGLGWPAPDAVSSSPVTYNYDWSSLAFLNDGGFPVQLTVTWSGRFEGQVIADIGDGFTVSSVVGNRSVTYGTRFQVREVRSVVTH